MRNLNPSLPEEILIEIFSRLPFKSVGKCKCLSKSWLSFLSSHRFISSYLSFNLCLTNDHQKLILITPSHSLQLVTPTINNDSVSRKIDLPGSWTRVIGSCKGLVLLTNKNGELYLVNPLTSRMVRIPDFDLSLKSDTTVITHGFGYDTCTDDYKIVMLSCNRGNWISHVNSFVDVYSVKKGVWKRIDDCWKRIDDLRLPYLFIHTDRLIVSGIYVSGAIHWQLSRWCRDSSIVATFDLDSEVFYDTGSPYLLNAKYKSLVGRGGRLCAVPSYCRSSGVVWTMEERGSVESWKKFTRLNANTDWSKDKMMSFFGEEEAVLTTKEEYESNKSWKRFRIPENEDWPKLKPVCFIGEEGIVLRAEDGRLFVHDIKEGTFKAFIVDGVPACCMDMGIGQW